MTTIIEATIIETSVINKSETTNVTGNYSIVKTSLNNESDMLSKHNLMKNQADNCKNQDKNDSTHGTITNVVKNNENETTFEMTDNNVENGTRVGEEIVLTDSVCGNNNISKTNEDFNEEISMNSGNMIADEDEIVKRSMPRKMLSLLDSESEDEDFSSLFPQKDNTPKDESNTGSTIGTDSLKYRKVSYNTNRRILDSDSETDEPSGNKNDGGDENHGITSNSDSDESLQKSKPNRNTISDLIDSDLDSDDNQNTKDDFPEDHHNEQNSVENKLKKSTKRRTQTVRSSKEEAMKQIRSESQRLIRETNISLPYHIPKQRTLQEFLNRKKIVSTLPKAPNTAAKVRMSSAIVSKVLEEKEREAELFYKSSDSEDETNDKELPKDTPVHNNVTNDFISVANDAASTDIEETQKMMKGNVQNAHNKKEIIQQGTHELGVPRKLFGLDSDEINEQENVQAREHEESPLKCVKEHKHGLKEVSVPRQLFGNDYQDDTDSNTKGKDIEEINAADALKNPNNEDDSQSDTIDTLIKSLEDEINKSNGKENSVKQTNSQMEVDEDILLQIAKDDLKMDEPREQQSIKDKESLSANNTISETPFISNKDLAQLNKKDNTTTSSVINQIDKSISSNIGETELSTPIGHVYGLPLPEFEDDVPTEKPSTVKKKILPSVTDVKPTLRGAPGMVIDFSQDVKPNKEGVNNLMNRFLKHSVINNKAETVTDVTVIHTEITADGVKTTTEVFPYKVQGEKNDAELNKPGAKHVRLREELKQKMFNKRTEEREQKEQEMKTLEEELYGDEKSTCGMDDEELEEEIEELSDTGESEPEEDDMPLRESKQKKSCPFVDNEAEVSDEEDAQGTKNDDDDDEYSEEERNINSGEEEIDCDEEEDENEENEEEDEEQEEDEDETEEDSDEELHEPRKLKRIVKAFDEDSNESKQSDDKTVNTEKRPFARTKTDVDMFDTDGNNDWMSDAEDEIPAFQPRSYTSDIRSQACQTPLVTTNCLSFVSPITQLTALNTHMDSAKKETPSSDVYSLPISGLLSTEKTPVTNSIRDPCFDKRIGLQKKLFEEDTELVKDEELMELCSGRFTGTANSDKDISTLLGSSTQTKSAEVELLEMCSGSFSTQQLQENQIEKAFFSIEDNPSENIRLTLNKSSQLSMKSPITNKKSDTPWTALRVVSTDEEDEVLKDTNDEIVKKKKLTKKKVKKLELSDEEDSDSERLTEVEEDEEVLDENEEKYIDYDSEENEIVVVPKGEIKKVAAKFLEAEAELSESDWDSADEDEKDLDKLEYEEGDNEEIDENQMKDQLGRIHMRQILDDDQRDVRMIKELLFEDGDLHTDGAGRERKFRWKNMDNFGEDVNDPLGDNADATLEMTEEENELQWHKLRLEREKFLEEKKKSGEIKDDIEDDMESSQFLKLGMRALKKFKSGQTESQSSSNELSKPTDPIMPRTILDLLDSPAIGTKSSILRTAVKRGSFLARGEQSLARLAVMVKQNTEKTICGAKNSRNFVFAHVSPAIEADEQNQEKTNENISDDNTRKRKHDKGLTPRTTKKTKIEGTTSKGKKLF